MKKDPPPGHRATDGRTTEVIVLLALVVVLSLHLAGAFAFIANSWRFIWFPGTDGYGEGPILYQLQALRSGTSFFTDISAPPYAVANYPPVFHLAAWPVTALTGDPLAAGRMISFLSALFSAALIFRLVQLSAKDEDGRLLPFVAGAVAGLFFLSHYSVILWAAAARVDLPALALGLLGMLVFRSALRRSSLWLSGLFGLIFVLAAFTKQNMIAPALATFATALILDRRLAYTAAAVAIPTGLAGVAGLEVWSGGQFLLHNFYYNANALDPELLLPRALAFVALHPAEILVLGFGGVGLVLARNRGGPGRDPSLILFGGFTLASLLNVVASVKHGAATNYFIEFQAAGSLLVGLVFLHAAAFLRNSQADPEIAKYRLAAILALAILGWQAVFGWVNKYRPPHQAILPAMQQVVELMDAADGPVISEDMVLLYRAGKRLYFQPFIMSRLALEGQWDPSPLTGAMERGEVAMIVLTSDIGTDFNEDRFFPAFAESLHAHYRLRGRFAHYQVFVPAQ